EATLAALGERFAALETDKNPFATKPPLTGPTTWLEPTLVVEVKFAEWTPGGHLRAPVLLRVRDDLNPRAVTRLQDRVPATPATSDKPKRTVGLDKVTPVLEQLDRAGENGVLEVEGQRIKLSHLNKVY